MLHTHLNREGKLMAIAKVQRYNGEPSIMIDGKPYPPMTMTVEIRNHDYLKDLGEAGIKIFYVCANTPWNDPATEPKEGEEPEWLAGNAAPHLDGLTKTLADLDFLMGAVPDGYVMLRLNVSPPADWVNSHPEEQLRYSDGKTRQVICTSVSMREILDGMHSLCSEAWREDGDKALTAYFDALRESPHFDRIIGFFLCAGGTSEWYYPQGLTTEDGAYGDFSEPFRKEFERFLRVKYGTVDELRRVWKRDDATFENPIIPTIADREFIFEADNKITKALREWETKGRTIGLELDINAREEANFGVFLNANGYTHVADFFTAWHESTARTIIHFAGTLKKFFPDLLVGAFYGSYGCTSYFDGGTCSGTLAILDSGLVDFLAAPGVYNNREPGGIVAQREMQDSFRLRNQIYICEDDSRTHKCSPWMQRDSMALYTVEDSITTMKRDFARNICEDIQGWWFDMQGNWYNDPKLLELISRQQRIAQYAYSIDRTKKNDIALIYDAESVHYVSQQTSQLVTDFYRTSDLGRIGAPVDYYFHNDMARNDMPDYKLYIMLNQYYLTDVDREAIKTKARKNGAVVLWLYAPGFINPDANTVMCVENIKKTIGMKVGFIGDTFFPHFRVDPASHPALRMTSASRRYGYIDRDVHSNIWIGPTVLPPVYLNPGFYIDDPDAIVLGRYCHNNKPAMAMKEMDGFTSIYCATQVLRSDMLASLANFSGCHLFMHQDDVLYANENFVAVHAKDDGVKTVYFKKPCSPYEVYEKKYYGHNVERIDVDMKLGDTKMWSINGEC
jgi:hypothetical protein